jgi:hypothetical protein
MQIEQFGVVFHSMDFNSLFQCVLWLGGAQQQQQQQQSSIGCRLAEV